MDFFDVVRARRSTRSFRSDPLGRELLTRVVEAGHAAPSGCNAQLRHFVVIDAAELLAPLRGLSRALAEAPAVIALLVEPRGTAHGEYWVQDAAAAMENMLLAATALGLGACWVEGSRSRFEPLLRDLLGVPAHLRVWSLLPLGRPARTPPRPPRPPLAEVLHFDRFAPAE